MAPLPPSPLLQVRHFFKVGEARAQGKACVLSLAYQLAEKLPGLAGKLEGVVEQHGAGAKLTLVEVFEK